MGIKKNSPGCSCCGCLIAFDPLNDLDGSSSSSSSGGILGADWTVRSGTGWHDVDGGFWANDGFSATHDTPHNDYYIISVSVDFTDHTDARVRVIAEYNEADDTYIYGEVVSNGSQYTIAIYDSAGVLLKSTTLIGTLTGVYTLTLCRGEFLQFVINVGSATSGDGVAAAAPSINGELAGFANEGDSALFSNFRIRNRYAEPGDPYGSPNSENCPQCLNDGCTECDFNASNQWTAIWSGVAPDASVYTDVNSGTLTRTGGISDCGWARSTTHCSPSAPTYELGQVNLQFDLYVTGTGWTAEVTIEYAGTTWFKHYIWEDFHVGSMPCVGSSIVLDPADAVVSETGFPRCIEDLTEVIFEAVE